MLLPIFDDLCRFFYHRSHRLASAALLVAVFKFTLLPFAPDTFALKEVCGSAGATAV